MVTATAHPVRRYLPNPAPSLSASACVTSIGTKAVAEGVSLSETSSAGIATNIATATLLEVNGIAGLPSGVPSAMRERRVSFDGRADETLDGFLRVAPSSSTRVLSGTIVPTAAVAEASVLLTPLPGVPGASVRRYLGPLQCSLVKDSEGSKTAAARDTSAAENFYHSAHGDAYALARAQVLALGGNALLCLTVTPQESRGGGTRNSLRHTILTLSGDVVLLEHDTEYAAMLAHARL